MKPSEFYRKLRPEKFSDSTLNNSITLKKEIATYHLSQLSTDQKEHQFENLGRLLAEKCICPNLIPATGPAGGGDGKTDTETYPVSTAISDRWFIPEKWENNQKRAFAMSVKTKWKVKLLSDIEKIIETRRGYNRIYFITNQKISDKKKKDTQDIYIKDFNIDIVILDGNWIIEKVYNENHLDIFVNSLGLNNDFIEETIKFGPKDYARKKQLDEVEKNIQDAKRYSTNDYQLGEECIASFILSRMLELPKSEITSKINRAKNIVEKIGNLSQIIKTYYQAARTYIQYIDDYTLFFQEYNSFKKYVIQSIDIDDIEKRKTLLILCISLKEKIDFTEYDFDLNAELVGIERRLKQFISDESRPTTVLIAKTYLLFLDIHRILFEGKKCDDDIFIELMNIIKAGKNHLSFPMKMVADVINIIGNYPIEGKKIDELFDLMSDIIGERDGELASARIYIKRGEQKLSSKDYKSSIVYFGKCISRLSKEEAKKDLIFALSLLGEAYKNLGLYWAAHSSFIAAFSIGYKDLIKTGDSHFIILTLLKYLIYNELISLGRVPNLLIYYLVYRGIFGEKEVDEDEKIRFENFNKELDRFLSCRLIGSNPIIENFVYMPDILSKLDLPFAEETALYILGHSDGLVSSGVVNNLSEVDDIYNKLASQPFLQQIVCDTNFLIGDIIFFSKITGLEFKVNMFQYRDYIYCIETFLAYIEAFFSTSITEALPLKDLVEIDFKVDEKIEKIFQLSKLSNVYTLSYNPKLTFENLGDIMIEIISQLIIDNFFVKDIGKYLETIFEKEELNQRVALITNHIVFKTNVFGNNGDNSIQSLVDACKAKVYDIKRNKLELNITDSELPEEEEKTITHQNIQVNSIINNQLWNNAGWDGVGFALIPYTPLPFLMIIFKDIENGILIFDERIKKLGGNVDKDEKIRISIIKGIHETNPYRYKVTIGPTLDYTHLQINGGFQISLLRIHTMIPENGDNLSNFIEKYSKTGSYYIIPAGFDNENKIQPIFDKYIQKKAIIIRNKNDIGNDDIDIVAIRDK